MGFCCQSRGVFTTERPWKAKIQVQEDEGWVQPETGRRLGTGRCRCSPCGPHCPLNPGRQARAKRLGGDSGSRNCRHVCSLLADTAASAADALYSLTMADPTHAAMMRPEVGSAPLPSRRSHNRAARDPARASRCACAALEVPPLPRNRRSQKGGHEREAVGREPERATLATALSLCTALLVF